MTDEGYTQPSPTEKTPEEMIETLHLPNNTERIQFLRENLSTINALLKFAENQLNSIQGMNESILKTKSHALKVAQDNVDNLKEDVKNLEKEISELEY